MIRHFMTVVNDGRAALLAPRECIRIHIVRCEYEGKHVAVFMYPAFVA